MPGIVGIINKGSQEKNTEDLRLMIDCIMHEPFYTSGIYINRQLGLYAGWVCHKDSFSDCMPIINEKKDLVLLFAGENFADKEVTDQLKRKGHEFDPSNASYLIHLYEEGEESFLGQLNGWFSGILVDLQKGKVILFNDRYGMQRIYYHEGTDAFLFSSEAKALLKVRPELRKIDMQSLGEFFMCDCILENKSLFSGIFLLPNGSSWKFDNSSKVKKDYYFKPNIWENQPVLEKELFYNRFRQTFLRILPRYFNGNQRIGMSLTSGLDTRVIMSYYQNSLVEKLPCYTFSGMYRDLLDAQIGRKVADACKHSHEIVRLDRNFLSDFPILAEKTVYITDGTHDVCGAYDFFFNSIAKEIAPVRMTGKFGSEVVGGHSMLKKTNKHCRELFDPDFKKYLIESVRTLDENKIGHRLSFAVFKEVPWREYGRLAMEMCKLVVRTPYMDNDLVKLMYQAPPEYDKPNEIRLRLIKDGNPKLRMIMTDRGTAGNMNPFFSSAACLMFYSLFKGEYVYLYQLPHWLSKLDHMFRSLHPEKLVVGRYQLGCYRLWFHNELSDYIQEILLDNRTANRPYLNKGFIEKMVNEHIKGSRNYVNEINKTVTTELIHRLLIENI